MSSNFDIAIDANKTVDQILELGTYSGKCVIQVANKTGHTLVRVGAHNDSSTWPVGNIGALRTAGSQLSGNEFHDSLSFAANYAIEGTGKHVQFAVSWPPIGSRKIEVGTNNEPGSSAAKETWRKMSNFSDKAVNNPPFQVCATLKHRDGVLIWFFEVK
ncbi:MAG: hypothetical protein RI964_1825 [Pseudomonadota bacterium]|jgi:hypothetical protein